jgi:4-aminobutyrate aminotransferase-like enzyme
MLGIALHDYDTTRRVVDYAFSRKVLLGWTLHSNTLIRIAPPLTISDETLNETLDTIKEALDKS